jgi:cell division protein FtsI/penicillin-binding protein 2
MKVREKKWIRARIYLVAAFFIAGLGIILARAYQLQVLQKEKLTAIALSAYRGIVSCLRNEARSMTGKATNWL